MDNNKIEVIYIEDDINLSMVVKDFLEMQNYIVNHFISAEELIDSLPNIKADICILDIMLPGMDGFELAKYLKKNKPNLPLIFLSAKDQTNDKIKGLQYGADDYLTKPFSTVELDLRIKSIVKRNIIPENQIQQKKYFWGSIIYIPLQMVLIVDNEEIILTKKENSLLQLLVAEENIIVKREFLLLEIWKDDSLKNSRSMDVYISKLRKILSAEPRIQIINFHGTGYKFDNTKLNKQDEIR